MAVMRVVRTALAATGLVVAGVAAASPAWAAENDSQLMCDTVPSNGGPTEICVRVNSVDYGTWRDVYAAHFTYNNSKVSHLYDAKLRIDNYGNNTFEESVSWATNYEGYTYTIASGVWDCWDPCRFDYMAVVSEIYDADSVTDDIEGQLEADDP